MAPGAPRRVLTAPAAPVRARRAPSRRPLRDLAASQRELIELDGELAVMSLRATERGLALGRATDSVRDVASVDRELGALSADLDLVLRRVARRARALGPADGALIEVSDSGGRVHRARVGGGVAPDQAWRADAAASAVRACSDTETDPRVDREACRALGVRSLVTEPLRRRGLRIGTITVSSSRPGAFDDGHLELLHLLARRATATVMRLRLVQELRKLDREHASTLVASEARFRRLFYGNPQPMWVIDAETQRFLAVNDAAVAKYGYTAQEFMAQTATLVRRDAAQWAADFERVRTGLVTLRARHRLRDGRLIDVEINSGPQEFNGRPAILSIINDVTERNRLEQELRESGFRDPLTGRANRTLLVERVRHALARTQRHGAVVGILHLDLDHFKTVNESMGYLAGDRVLQAVAARLAVTLRPGDTVARLSADEFAVLLEDVGDLDRCLEVAERVHATFNAPLDFEGGQLTIGLSIGVAVSSASGPGADELLRDAELAMHAAKSGGRGRVEAFSPRMRVAMERLSLDQDLRRAVERGELRLHYQPLISLQSGAIVGCEALVRWEHPTRGLVPPDSFISLAEESGVIGAIDTWVLRTACTQAAAWGEHDLFVAVNVSGQELGRGDLVDRIEAALFESGLPANRLEVEVTETVAAAQPEEALEELRQLRRAGITVAVDDFGTGYSSLSKLATFPVDRIKIDRSFLSSISVDAADDPLVAAMIGMAHGLRLEVTAEGVETPAQLALLRRAGCDLLQGYLFSRPVPADRFEALLAGWSPAAGAA